MRCLALLLLVACDLQPPKREPPKATQPPPAVIAADAAAAPADAALPVADARVAVVTGDGDIEPTQECLDVAVDISEKLIQAVQDPTERAAWEQDRTRMVKTTSRACTQFNWTEPQRKCFFAAKTKEEIDTCAKVLPTAQPPPSPPPAGSGSGPR